MATLTKREEIRDNVRPNDKASEKLIYILKMPVMSYENAKIQARLRQLEELVIHLKPDEAENLYKRLNDPHDFLSQLFNYELSTPSRRRIMAQIKSKQVIKAAPTFSYPPQSYDFLINKMVEDKKTSPPSRKIPNFKMPILKIEPVKPPAEDWPPGKYLGPRPVYPAVPITPSFKDVVGLIAFLAAIYALYNNGKNFLLAKALNILLNKIKDKLDLLNDLLDLNNLAFEIVNAREIKAKPGLSRDIKLKYFHFHDAELERNWQITHQRELGELRDLDYLVNQSLDLIDGNADPDTILERYQDTGKSPIRVDPRARGYAVEDYYLGKVLKGKRYTGLPNYFKGIDAIKGKYVEEIIDGKKVKVYRKPDTISIKSTDSTDPAYIRRQFDNSWMKYFKDNGFEYKKENIKVVGFGKKEIHLIFEEGQALDVVESKELLETLKEIKKSARSQGVTFKWFIITHDRIKEGNEFIKDLDKAIKGK